MSQSFGIIKLSNWDWNISDNTIVPFNIYVLTLFFNVEKSFSEEKISNYVDRLISHKIIEEI